MKLKLTPAQLEALDVTGFWLEPREPAVAEMEEALTGRTLTLPKDVGALNRWYILVNDAANHADYCCLRSIAERDGMARFHARDRACLTRLAHKLLDAWWAAKRPAR